MTSARKFSRSSTLPPRRIEEFYRRHGFELVSPERKTALLRTYWTVPDRQIETSVVLANPPY